MPTRQQISVWKKQHAAQRQAAFEQQRKEAQALLNDLGSGWGCPSPKKTPKPPVARPNCLQGETETSEWAPCGVAAGDVFNAARRPVLLQAVKGKKIVLFELQQGGKVDENRFKPLLSHEMVPDACKDVGQKGVQRAECRGAWNEMHWNDKDTGTMIKGQKSTGAVIKGQKSTGADKRWNHGNYKWPAGKNKWWEPSAVVSVAVPHGSDDDEE
ncbi:hypothetical protein EDC01DRAFT_776336 [Geopyxis carbonaria]|nr:hypothetical protein EDC01DRAFT_776336 [Geopyxis carbonaria]